MQANPTLTAMVQLASLIVAMAAVVVLGIDHAIDRNATAGLIGVGLAHAGISAYNGATKGAPPTIPAPPPNAQVTTEVHTTSVTPAHGQTITASGETLAP